MNVYAMQVMATDRFDALLHEAGQARAARPAGAVPSAPPAVPSAPPAIVRLLARARRLALGHRSTRLGNQHQAA